MSQHGRTQNGVTEPAVSPGAVAAYVAIALENFFEALRRDDKPVPREVADLARLFKAWARPGGAAVVAPWPEPERQRLLTYKQVGHLLGDVSEKTVQRLVRDGGLRAVWINSRPRVHVDDLDAYLDALRANLPDCGGPGWTTSADVATRVDDGVCDQEDNGDGADQAA